MRKRLQYYIQPLYQPWSADTAEASQLELEASPHEVRSAAYRQAQALREKLQHEILLRHQAGEI